MSKKTHREEADSKEEIVEHQEAPNLVFPSVYCISTSYCLYMLDCLPKSTLTSKLEERINFYKSFSPKELQVEKLVTMETLQGVGLIASHEGVTHLSIKESVQEARRADLYEVKEAITVITIEEALKLVKADEKWLEIGGDNSRKA
uniref:Uncharacterized protein n=1 Tax=Cannabis sativa TaxID=3483 RepID=A0A803PU71_CANSA